MASNALRAPTCRGDKKKKISLFQRHKAKLAWALVYVTSLKHNTLVPHNDFFPINIFIHFPKYSNEMINIRICNWRTSSHMQERASLCYGYDSEEEMLENMAKCS